MRTIERVVQGIRKTLDAVGAQRLTSLGRPIYHRLLWLTYPRGVPRSIHAEPLLYFLPEACCVPEDGEPAVYQALKRLAATGQTVLDVGANIGAYSLLLGRWVGPSGKVFAFEPAPRAADALRRHAALNGLTGPVEVVQAVVGNCPGRVRFFADGVNMHNSVSPEALRDGSAIEVQALTIDSFCLERRVRPTLIKIDVEGYEPFVLRGAAQTIATDRPRLLIETHPWLWPGLGVAREAMQALVEEVVRLGYSVEVIEGPDDYLSERAFVLLTPTDSATGRMR